MDAEECWIQGGVNHYLKVFSSDSEMTFSLEVLRALHVATTKEG